MKFKIGQEIILLATDGKPAAGKAVVDLVDETNQFYRVVHYLNDNAIPEVIEDVPEGRLVTATDLVRSILNSR
ncbi:MAG: hypothetical protein JWQ79_2546 [Mucilaginibacter sp.]|nr:hypothetical protein [Mucilaginibacter sp.]